MKKLLLSLFSLLFCFIFVFNSFSNDDTKPRLLTNKERREICRDMNELLNTLRYSHIGAKKGSVICYGRGATIMQITMDGMTEEKANNFFSEEMKNDFTIAGYKKIYFKSLEGDTWTLDLK